MAPIKLSILIATMPSRQLKFENLLYILEEQCGDVEIISDGEMGYNIGAKRNLLVKRALGEYIVFVDDDDFVSDDYIEKILAATESKPDCIGISGTIKINGGAEQQWHISKDYGSWYENSCIYYRTPNHISPVRRELALQVGFKEISFGEDYDYSKRLLPLLKTEVKVPGNIYLYDYYDKTNV